MTDWANPGGAGKPSLDSISGTAYRPGVSSLSLMPAKRRESVSFLEGKKMPRRIRVKFTAPKSKGAKRVSFLEGKKSPRRTRVTFMAKRGATARSR